MIRGAAVIIGRVPAVAATPAQQVYQRARTDSEVNYTFIVPAGPTVIHLAAIAARGANYNLGGGQFDFGGGGGLGYRNSLSVPADRTFYVRIRPTDIQVSTGFAPSDPSRTLVLSVTTGTDGNGGGYSNGGGFTSLSGVTGFNGGIGHSQGDDPEYGPPNTAGWSADGAESAAGTFGSGTSLLGPAGGSLIMGGSNGAMGVRFMWDVPGVSRAYPSTNVADQFI